jgi:hypothetical protein
MAMQKLRQGAFSPTTCHPTEAGCLRENERFRPAQTCSGQTEFV